jgi:hypothetical protein
MHDCRQYFAATGRRVTFEYTLMAGVNASPQDVSSGHLTDLQTILSKCIGILGVFRSGQRYKQVTASSLPLPAASRGCTCCVCQHDIRFTCHSLTNPVFYMHQAEQLAALLRRFDLRSHVNVIPVRR